MYFPSEYNTHAVRERKRRRFSIVALLFLVLLFIGYFVYQSRAWVIPPKLMLESPADGAVFAEGAISVGGTVAPGALLTINGREAYSDEARKFSFELLLPPGVHTIEVKAQDRFGKETSITRQIVVKEVLGN